MLGSGVELLTSYYSGSKITNGYPRKQREARKTHRGSAGRARQRWRITQTCVLCRMCSLFFSLLCILLRNRLCHHQLLTTGRIPWMDTVWNGEHA